MSQVIVTNDKLKQKRDASRTQEHHIDRETQFAAWRRGDITGKSPLTALIGLAVSPIWVLWTVLTGMIYVMMTVLRFLFTALGGVIGGRKSLITGEKIDR